MQKHHPDIINPDHAYNNYLVTMIDRHTKTILRVVSFKETFREIKNSLNANLMLRLNYIE